MAFGNGGMLLGLTRKRGGAIFSQQVLDLFSGNVIGYWKMDETTGTAAVDSSPEGNNGTYTGVTLANAALPAAVGGSAPYFDGANDNLSVISAGLLADIDFTSGTVIQLIKANTGLWTNSALNYTFSIVLDGSNFLLMRDAVGSNQFQWQMGRGGTLEAVSKTSVSTLDWFMASWTWDVNAGADGECKAYWNASQEGATQTALGTWSGTPTQINIGAYATTPANVWDGWIGHTIILDRAATPTEIATLYGYTGL